MVPKLHAIYIIYCMLIYIIHMHEYMHKYIYIYIAYVYIYICIYIYINIYIYVHATVVYRIIQENRSFAGSGSTCRAQGGVAGATTGVISMKDGV